MSDVKSYIIYLADEFVTRSRDGQMSTKFSGLEINPIPDDVVLVPREKIEALAAYFNGQKKPPGISWCGDFYSVAMAILACADPPKPKDEKLERLYAAREYFRAYIDGHGHTVQEPIDMAIAARERELKERA